MKIVIFLSVLIFLLPQAFSEEPDRLVTIILDDNGNAPKNVNPEDTLQVKGSLHANQMNKEFVFLVQVEDMAGYTVFLESTSEAFANNQTASIHWRPSYENSYTIQTFLWTSIDSPSPLSYDIPEISVNVCSGDASCVVDIVRKIVDGDTLDVGKSRVRLALVNTPERGDAGYSDATNFTSSICPVGSTALVDEDDGQTGGSYGRIIGKVYCQDKVLNAELLAAKHAVVYEEYCRVSEFADEGWVSRYCS